MPSIINLSPIWEHTLTEILIHGNKTEVGIFMRSWVKDNNLEDMNDLLIHDQNDFTPRQFIPIVSISRSRRHYTNANYTFEGTLQPL